MCLKKILAWFNGTNPTPAPTPDPEPIPTTMAKRILLSFAINDYPGSSNDLKGCINDQKNLKATMLAAYPDFDVRTFTNSEVTKERYQEEVAKAIAELSPGATVLVLADSCFSGTVTRLMNSDEHPTRNRFMPTDLPERKIRRRRLFRRKENMKWATISGCGEHQTCADAYIGGKYNGAFTYYLCKAYLKGMTIKEWYLQLRKFLPSDNYDQAPELEGMESIFERILGEGETLIIHNSSHGSYTYDTNGDERDGMDEVICCYDQNITDDEINALLQKIPV